MIGICGHAALGVINIKSDIYLSWALVKELLYIVNDFMLKSNPGFITGLPNNQFIKDTDRGG